MKTVGGDLNRTILWVVVGLMVLVVVLAFFIL